MELLFPLFSVKDEPWDSSGDIGFAKSLSRCCYCSITCEQKRCKKTLPPKKWFCEECQSSPRSGVKNKFSKTHSSSSSAVVNQENIDSSSLQSVRPDIFPRNEGMRVPSEVRRINKSAKVKFLPAEEVINLKSGTKAVAQVLHCNLGFQTNPLDPSSAICKRTEALGKITTSKSFLLTEIMNPLALHGMQTSTTLQQQAVKMSDSFNGEEHPPGFPSKQSAIGSAAIAKVAEGRPGKSVAINADAELGSRWSVLKVKEARGKKVGSIPRKESIQEGPDDVAIPSEKVEASSRPESQTSDSVTAPSIYAKPPFIGSSGISFPSGLSSRCVNVQERDLVQIFPLSQRHPLSGPALKVIWKGSFEVLDFSSDNGIYEGFLAHPSAKISCKAYEFARQIAGVLQFRIHSRRAFWPEIFDSDCPDANDIAMYFYPGKIERSKRQYAFLLKLIEKHDLMLRSRMGHVELLVFPSKLLHVDSQKLDGSYFMWGVFRNLKGKKVAYEAEALPF